MNATRTPAEANRLHWDSDAERYHHEHQHYLDGFHWCPEMLSEREANLLGDVRGKTILEIGCGSAPCSDWLVDQGPALVAGFDISINMLSRHRPARVPLVQADAQALPFRTNSFDVAFSVFGAFPFVPDISLVLDDVARVLRPGGRLVFSVNHPMRWVFPDDPGPAGLVAQIPYFDREYLEHDDNGELVYAEYHRTFGDWVRALRQSSFVLDDVIEPSWPADLDQTWGQWSPLRGAIFPGSIVFAAHLPD